MYDCAHKHTYTHLHTHANISTHLHTQTHTRTPTQTCKRYFERSCLTRKSSQSWSLPFENKRNNCWCSIFSKYCDFISSISTSIENLKVRNNNDCSSHYILGWSCHQRCDMFYSNLQLLNKLFSYVSLLHNKPVLTIWLLPCRK